MCWKNDTCFLRHHDRFPNETTMHMHVFHIHKHTRKSKSSMDEILMCWVLYFIVSRSTALHIRRYGRNSVSLMGHCVSCTIIFNKYFRFPIPEVPRHSSPKRQAAKTIRSRIPIMNNVSCYRIMVIEKSGHVEKMRKTEFVKIYLFVWCALRYLKSSWNIVPINVVLG